MTRDTVELDATLSRAADPSLHPVPRTGQAPPSECGWELDTDVLFRVASLGLQMEKVFTHWALAWASTSGQSAKVNRREPGQDH